jgi:hypothetical protein
MIMKEICMCTCVCVCVCVYMCLCVCGIHNAIIECKVSEAINMFCRMIRREQ